MSAYSKQIPARFHQRAFLNRINENNIMQTAKPHLELLTSEAAIATTHPTALFHQVCGARPATLLLESADIDSKDDLRACCWWTARCALRR